MTTVIPQLAFLLAFGVAGAPASGAPSMQLERAWARDLPATPRTAPFTLESCAETRDLVVLAYPGLLEVRRAGDGTVAWRLEGAGDVVLATTAGVACDPPRIAAWHGPETGPGGGRLVLLDARTGRELAGTPTGQPAVGPPVGTPERGGWILPLADGRVALFDAEGRPEGHVELQAPVAGTILRVAGRPLIAQADRSRLLRADGGAISARRLGGLDLARAASDGDWFLAARDDRLVTAVRCKPRRRGRLRCRRLWTQRLAGTVAAPPVLDGTAAYVPSRDTHVYAFRRDNGHVLWRTGLGHRLGRLVGLTPGLLLAAGEKAALLFLLSRDGGASSGATDAGAGNPAAVIVAGPVAAGGRALVAVLTPPAEHPELVAFRLAPRPEAGDAPASSAPRPDPDRSSR